MEGDRIEPDETLSFPKKILEGFENDDSSGEELEGEVIRPKDEQKVKIFPSALMA